MARAANEFQESLKQYKEKKEECIAFVSQAEKTAAAYLGDFPPPEKEEAQNLAQEFAEIRSRIESSKLRILVAGQFKMGKSTLVNALLGEEVLPAYSTPCTAVITAIEYGDNKKAVLSFKSPIADLPENISPRIAAHIGNKRENIPDFVVESENLGDELEQYLVIPEEDADRNQKDTVAESPYSLCRLSWPLEICRNDVEIIDSPGLNEATARDETTYRFVPQADMILHVLNANQLYGQYDKEFVASLEKRGRPPLIFLVNRFDQLNSEKEQNRVRSYAAKILTQATPYEEDGIFFVSAFKALSGKTDNNAALYAASGFPDFERMLARTVARDRGKIKLAGNLRDALVKLENQARNLIPELRKKLDRDVTELEKKFNAQQKEFARLDEKKERIEKMLESGLNNIKKMMALEIKSFFNNFAAESLEDYVNAASFELSIINKKESQKRAVEAMSEAMIAGLRTEFDEFNNEKTAEIAQEMDDLKERLQDQLQEFNEMLDAIRVDLDMQVSEQNMAISNRELGDVDFGDLVGEGIGGALLGGGVGVGAVFLASRFFAIFGGPVGWGITILSTLGAALLAILNSSAAEEKMKAEYIKVARKRLREEAGNWATQLSDDLGENLAQQKQMFMNYLNTRIEETRNPILEAIEMMKNSHVNLDEKKAQLDSFQKRFTELEIEGRKLEASL